MLRINEQQGLARAVVQRLRGIAPAQMKPNSLARVDFHLHSYASNVTDYYAANSFSIPESYSDPLELYRELKRQGMSLVTLTDHNSIDGVKLLLDKGLPDVFISSELTATFPEDGCNVHITVANVTEKQFTEANRLRANIYELLDYVDREIAGESPNDGNRIAYFMTHPLMSTQNRPHGREGALSLHHLERLLLLVNAFEVRNGTRTRALNEFTRQWLESLDAATIDRLANKHGLAPKGAHPWRKAVLAGSDDHSGINPGRTWTEFDLPKKPRAQPNDVIDAIRAGRTRPMGQYGGPTTLAHAMLKLLYDGRKASVPGQGRTLRVAGPVNTLLRMVFDADSVSTTEKLRFRLECWVRQAMGGKRSREQRFEQVLSAQISALVGNPAFRAKLSAAACTDDKIFLVVSTLINRLFAHYIERVATSDRSNVVCVVKELVALVSSNVLVSLPYLLAYLHQSSDRAIVRDVRKSFGLDERQRLVLMTDTFFDVNGVSRTIRRMLDESERRGIDLVVVTCLSPEEMEAQTSRLEVRKLVEGGRLKLFSSVVTQDFPMYAGLKIHFPPFLELLKYLQEEGFTKMQISTPGTVGIAGLLAAKILQLETSSTYHTNFPEYVEDFTKDISLEALTWKYMILFYHSVDEVVVPSKYIAKLLHERGLRNRSLLVLDRWVDCDRFHPCFRDEGYWVRRGVADAAAKTKFVYVGRVSVEKNLGVMAAAFRALHAERQDIHLMIVGDGPHRAALEAQLSGLPVTFTGMLEGAELSRALASCDAKLFPSTTDTWGNAPLEAQACGLPVVVSDMGGPQELMVDGETGIRVRGRDIQGLVEAMRTLCDRPTRMQMSFQARAFAEANRIDEPFTAILDAAAYRRKAKLARREPAEPEPPRPQLELITTVAWKHEARVKAAVEA